MRWRQILMNFCYKSKDKLIFNQYWMSPHPVRSSPGSQPDGHLIEIWSKVKKKFILLYKIRLINFSNKWLFTYLFMLYYLIARKSHIIICLIIFFSYKGKRTGKWDEYWEKYRKLLFLSSFLTFTGHFIWLT